MQERDDEIKYIQNYIWKMYKDYLDTHDMPEYNRKMGELVKRYHDKKDKLLMHFCQNLLISWCPVITEYAKEHWDSEKEKENDESGEKVH